MRKKEFLARLLHYSRVLKAFGNRSKNRLLVFNYHRIRPDAKNFATPFDDFGYGPTARVFRRQMQWLRENTHLISEANILSCLRAPKTFSKPCALVTFDDGYRDNYTLAYPILREFEIPAIFFIPTESISTRRVGHWDLVAYLLKQTRKPYLVFDEERFVLPEQRAAAIQRWQMKLKLSHTQEVPALLRELVELCEVALPSLELQDQELMRWHEVQEVAQHNITIGSHTHTHPCLSRLSAQEQQQEMALSKRILEEKLSLPVRSIGYPYGSAQFINAETLHTAKACGYDLGFSFLSGFNRMRDFTPFSVKRTEAPADLRTLVATLVFPELFARPLTRDLHGSPAWAQRSSHKALVYAGYALARILDSNGIALDLWQ